MTRYITKNKKKELEWLCKKEKDLKLIITIHKQHCISTIPKQLHKQDIIMKQRCLAYNQPSHTKFKFTTWFTIRDNPDTKPLIPYEISLSLTLPLWHQMPKRVGFMKLQGAKAVGELLNIIIVIIKGTGSLKTLLLVKLSVTLHLVIMCCTVSTSICC